MRNKKEICNLIKCNSFICYTKVLEILVVAEMHTKHIIYHFELYCATNTGEMTYIHNVLILEILMFSLQKRKRMYSHCLFDKYVRYLL